MSDIVYNACYGGFSLSHKACKRYAELKGFPLFAFIHKEGNYHEYVMASDEEAGNATFVTYYTTSDQDDGSYWSCRDIERDDPDLVAVVKELGEESYGSCAKLKIAKLPTGTLYRIDEYDGFESVATNDSYEWKVAK